MKISAVPHTFNFKCHAALISCLGTRLPEGPDQTQENTSARLAPKELRRTAITGSNVTSQVFIFFSLMATWTALISDHFYTNENQALYRIPL